ncbi:MAG: tetratricopeptide repeat protein [bacterium]|nr:tetratricopeptide repeat protein [bacterium]
MPGWYEATEDLRRQGKLKMMGLIQEQHPERCRLFMQWKQIDCPVMADPLNLLGVKVVPIALGIDEHGIVRAHLRRPGDLKAFLELEPEGAPPPAVMLSRPKPESMRPPADSSDAAAWRRFADATALWSGPERLDEAIDAYRRSATFDSSNAATMFRLGVAHRMRFDSDQRRPGDFAKAVGAWQAALEADPNNYIWRRRIQQYGPRLDKPYAFYDWIHEARREIEARGESPVPLRAEPRGAEFAAPIRAFASQPSPAEQPDPAGKITRDPGQLIEAGCTVVPPVVAPGRSVRVHLSFRPNAKTQAHWNNETGDLGVWLNLPEGWTADRSAITFPNPAKPLTEEPRHVEFELRCAADAEPAEQSISAYALYYVCQGATGKCLYRRQDLNVEVMVTPAAQ